MLRSVFRRQVRERPAIGFSEEFELRASLSGGRQRPETEINIAVTIIGIIFRIFLGSGGPLRRWWWRESSTDHRQKPGPRLLQTMLCLGIVHSGSLLLLLLLFFFCIILRHCRPVSLVGLIHRFLLPRLLFLLLLLLLLWFGESGLDGLETFPELVPLLLRCPWAVRGRWSETGTVHESEHEVLHPGQCLGMRFDRSRESRESVLCPEILRCELCPRHEDVDEPEHVFHPSDQSQIVPTRGELLRGEELKTEACDIGSVLCEADQTCEMACRATHFRTVVGMRLVDVLEEEQEITAGRIAIEFQECCRVLGIPDLGLSLLLLLVTLMMMVMMMVR